MKKFSEAAATLFTPIQLKRIEANLDIKANPGSIDKAVFQHSILCNVFFPYQNPGDDVRIWSKEFRNASLNLNVIERKDKQTKEVKSYGLPYGANARLIMAYVNTLAIKRQDPVIPLGANVNRFIEALGKSSKDGRTRKGIKDQLNRITHSVIQIGLETEDKKVSRMTGSNLLLIDDFDLWYSKSGDEQFLFPSFIKLSDRYFENLLEHAVPLDERAMFALSKDAMALDIYTWLANRLHGLKKPQKITWKAMKDQFGQTYKRMNDFKGKFRQKMVKVSGVYPAARVEEETNKYFTLYNSPPPIPPKPQLMVFKPGT